MGPEFARDVYASVLGWYESADRKAQLILTIDGVFLSFLTGTLLSSPEEVADIVGRFRFDTWAFLGVMTGSLIASLIAALLVLVSRLYTPQELQAELDRLGVDPDDGATFGPEVLWFFQVIAELNPAAVEQRLATADREFATRAMTAQVVRLAPRVRAKHRLVNLGFLLVVVTLVCFLAAGVSYVIRVA